MYIYVNFINVHNEITPKYNKMIKSNHITYIFIYIESFSTLKSLRYFVNCLLPQLVLQGSFSWPKRQWLAQTTQRDKSWRETIFKIMAGKINVSTCYLSGSYWKTNTAAVMHLLIAVCKPDTIRLITTSDYGHIK